MSELKRFNIVGKYADEETVYEFVPDGECYDADEVDKVVAGLKEAHKMEVEQLLILNKEQVVTANQLRDSMEQVIRHQKYKRCVAMADMCSARYDEEDANVNGHGTSWDYTSKEMKYWDRWHKRWLKLAKHFKEAK